MEWENLSEAEKWVQSFAIAALVTLVLSGLFELNY